MNFVRGAPRSENAQRSKFSQPSSYGHGEPRTSSLLPIRWRAIRQGCHRGLANHRTRRPPTRAPKQAAPIQIHGHVPNMARHRLVLLARDSFRAQLQPRLYQTSLRLHPALFLGARAGEATIIFWTLTLYALGAVRPSPTPSRCLTPPV